MTNFSIVLIKDFTQHLLKETFYKDKMSHIHFSQNESIALSLIILCDSLQETLGRFSHLVDN